MVQAGWIDWNETRRRQFFMRHPQRPRYARVTSLLPALFLLCAPVFGAQAAQAAHGAQAAEFRKAPACSFDAKAVQLRKDLCVGFDAGAYASRHSYEEAGQLRCTDEADVPCPTLRVLTRANGKTVVRAFAPPPKSSLGDPSDACVIDTIAVNRSGSRFALQGQGRDCFGGTARFSVEDVYELKSGVPALVKKNGAYLR
jgi:hypothetical protein